MLAISFFGGVEGRGGLIRKIVIRAIFSERKKTRRGGPNTFRRDVWGKKNKKKKYHFIGKGKTLHSAGRGPASGGHQIFWKKV